MGIKQQCKVLTLKSWKKKLKSYQRHQNIKMKKAQKEHKKTHKKHETGKYNIQAKSKIKMLKVRWNRKQNFPSYTALQSDGHRDS